MKYSEESITNGKQQNRNGDEIRMGFLEMAFGALLKNWIF